jgi:pimeloyl-ACP methyl ester carboxylesterase
MIAMLNPTSSKSVTLSSGVMLPFIKHSDPSVVPVALLHGVTDSRQHLEFSPSSEPLHVFTHTQRSHGNTEHHVLESRLQEFTKAVAALMGAVGLESALIVGTSARASVVQRLAKECAKRTSGLVLMGSFVAYHDMSVAFYSTAIVPLAASVDPTFTLEFRAGTLAKPLPQAWLESFVQKNLNRQVDVVEVEVTRKLAKVKAPTLIVWNNADVSPSRSSDESLQTSILDARLTKNSRGVLYSRERRSVLRLLSWQWS